MKNAIWRMENGGGKHMRFCLLIFLSSIFLSGVFVMTSGALSLRQDPQKPQDPQKKSEQGEEVISVETNLIVVNATVTDALENYVSGLKIEDFKILEDTAPQRILDLTVDEAPFAAAILLDTSGSMGNKLSMARAACGNFLSVLP